MAGTHSPWAAGDAGAGPSRGVAAPPPPPREEQEHELAPLVIVEGFLCAASSFLWGEFAVEMQLGEQHRRAQRAAADGKRPQHPGSPPQAPRRVIWAPIGPVSSIHDRACELFYSLRGGTVDYGAAHAAEHGHGRWGRSYPPQGGACAAWSAERPVHLVGHSLGGATILKLRSLLNAGFFDDVLQIETPAGEPSRAAYMVRSITTISSPLRGTPLVYLLGEQPSPSPAVRFLSAGDMLAKTVHLAVFLRAHFAAARRVLPDPQADAWAFSGARSHAELVDSSIGSTAQAEAPPSVSGRGWSWRAGWGLPSLLGNLWRSEWAEGRDCAPWDCTLGERARCEQEEPEAWIVGTEQGRHAPTWFRSFACYMTEPVEALGTSESAPRPRMHQPTTAFQWTLSTAPLVLTSRLLGRFDFSVARPSELFPGSSDHSAGNALLDASRRAATRRPHDDSGYSSPGPQQPLMPAFEELDEKLATAASEHEHEAWYANDGVVPLASQYHPGSCEQVSCLHSLHLPEQHLAPSLDVAFSAKSSADSGALWHTFSRAATLLSNRLRHAVPDEESLFAAPASRATAPAPPALPPPDRWEVFHLQDASHASLCPIWNGGARQRHFWRGMGCWLVDVDASAAALACETSTPA